MAVLIRIIENAAGLACLEAGMFVAEMDVDAFNGQGRLVAAADPANARRFATVRKALEYYKRPSTVRPWRPDGKPNRPLTAYTVEILREP